MNAIQSLIPNAIQSGTDEYRKARILAITFVIAFTFSLLHVSIYYYVEYYWGTITLFVTAFLVIAIAFIFKKTASFYLTGNLLAISAYGTLFSLAYTDVAITGPFWFIICPIFGFLFSGKSSGYFWSVIAVLTMVTFHALRIAGFEFYLQHDASLITYNEMVTTIGITIFVLAIIIVYEREKDRLVGQLRESYNDVFERNNEITQQNEEIRQQQEEIITINENLEEEQKKLIKAHDFIQATNKNVTDSIRYASTIQSAVLPDRNYMENIFNDLFILYKPKDIVSGDFYWAIQVGNKKVIAVCDCTGHGVPGAFMSMIGAMLLTEIVNKQQVTNPAQILELLDESVRRRLNQRAGENKDGMDVCLCVIEEEEEKVKVEFTGAKRDLYYYSEQKLGLLKGDRRTIGGFMISRKQFTTVALSLNKGDILYLSTDGLFDQANHEREKFGSRRFRDFVALYKQESMQQQGALLANMLQQHQADTPQRDDVTLIGIKL